MRLAFPLLLYLACSLHALLVRGQVANCSVTTLAAAGERHLSSAAFQSLGNALPRFPGSQSQHRSPQEGGSIRMSYVPGPGSPLSYGPSTPLQSATQSPTPSTVSRDCRHSTVSLPLLPRQRPAGRSMAPCVPPCMHTLFLPVTCASSSTLYRHCRKCQ